MSPCLIPVLPRGIDDAAVGFEELVGHLEHREDQRALRAPRGMAAAGLAPDEFARRSRHARDWTFLVDETAFEHIALLDVDMLMVGQHRAGREPHQSGHQAALAIEQQRLGLAAWEARGLPLHAGGLNQMGMRVGALRARCCHGVHGDAPCSDPNFLPRRPGQAKRDPGPITTDMRFAKVGATVRSNNNVLWLWVPACAGTT